MLARKSSPPKTTASKWKPAWDPVLRASSQTAFKREQSINVYRNAGCRETTEAVTATQCYQNPSENIAPIKQSHCRCSTMHSALKWLSKRKKYFAFPKQDSKYWTSITGSPPSGLHYTPGVTVTTTSDIYVAIWNKTFGKYCLATNKKY